MMVYIVNIAPFYLLILLKFCDPNKNGLLRNFLHVYLNVVMHCCVWEMSCCWHGISIWRLGLWQSNQAIGLLLLGCILFLLIGMPLMCIVIPASLDILIFHNRYISLPPFVFTFFPQVGV